MGTDDLDGVLVGAHGTVGAETVELALGGAGLHDGNLALDREGLEGHVVHDADGEVGLGLLHVQVVEHGDDLGRGGVLGGQAVAAADDQDILVLALEEGLDVGEEGFAHGAGFLRAVQDGDAADALREDGEEVLLGERTVEVDGDEAVLAAAAGEVVDGLLDGLGDGAHGDDDVLGGGIAVVLERAVAAAGELGNLTHVAGDDVRNGVVALVAGLDGLEIDVTVLGGTAGHGRIRIEGAGAEAGEGLFGDHLAEFVFRKRLDLLDFVAGAETVEEVQERDGGLDRGEVRHGGDVLGFLDGAGGDHGEAGLAAGHHVLVVTEDGEGVGGEGAGGHVEHGREHLAGDLVHVRDHQQETLGCRERGSEGTSLEGTVHGAGGAGLALHLGHFHRLAPEVLLPVGGPLVDVLGHGGRRRDRVDGGVLAEQVGDVRSGIVTITGDEFLFVSHNS